LACKSVFDRAVLPSMLRWLNEAALQWMALILRRPLASLEQWKARLESHLYQMVAIVRTNELFDIIVDYPESMPALLDLKECLSMIDHHLELVSSLTQKLSKRLLHSGASTSDIITTYVSTIRSLRLLDPSSVLLDAIRPLIATYLRGRDDTMRCVVKTVTEETNAELYEELGHVGTELREDYDEDSEEIDEEGIDWSPAPIHADIEVADDAARQMDTVSLLVQIYGSDDLFIQEYRSMLASRLLEITDYNTDKELHSLELLKLRFGEARLHECEIMLQDISESRRLNTNIKNKIQSKTTTGTESGSFLDTTIISPMFWPSLREEGLTLPPSIQRFGKVLSPACLLTIEGPPTDRWKNTLLSIRQLKLLASSAGTRQLAQWK